MMRPNSLYSHPKRYGEVSFSRHAQSQARTESLTSTEIVANAFSSRPITRSAYNPRNSVEKNENLSDEEDDFKIRKVRQSIISASKVDSDDISEVSIKELPSRNMPSHARETDSPEESSSEDANDAATISSSEGDTRPPVAHHRLPVTDSIFHWDKFSFQPAPQGAVIRCCVTHGRITTKLYIEGENREKILRLVAQRTTLSRPKHYVIYCQPNPHIQGSSFKIGKLHSNFTGSQYVLYDNGISPSKAGRNVPPRQEMAWTIYDTNILGLQGPRYMTVLIPAMNSDRERIEFRQSPEDGSMLDRYVSGNCRNIVMLNNKEPENSTNFRKSGLHFRNRVPRKFMKNFQLFHESDPERMILQFGRTKKHVYSMDYSYPMCALQAFGIVMSSLDRKLLTQ